MYMYVCTRVYTYIAIWKSFLTKGMPLEPWKGSLLEKRFSFRRVKCMVLVLPRRCVYTHIRGWGGAVYEGLHWTMDAYLYAWMCLSCIIQWNPSPLLYTSFKGPKKYTFLTEKRSTLLFWTWWEGVKCLYVCSSSKASGKVATCKCSCVYGIVGIFHLWIVYLVSLNRS